MVVDQVTVLMDDIGMAPEESIPGLIATIALLANDTSDPRQALDEAVAMLDEVTN